MQAVHSPGSAVTTSGSHSALTPWTGSMIPCGALRLTQPTNLRSVSFVSCKRRSGAERLRPCHPASDEPTLTPSPHTAHLPPIHPPCRAAQRYLDIASAWRHNAVESIHRQTCEQGGPGSDSCRATALRHSSSRIGSLSLLLCGLRPSLLEVISKEVIERDFYSCGNLRGPRANLRWWFSAGGR